MRVIWCAMLLSVTLRLHAQASEPQSDAQSVPEEVLVTGEYPGPGMWKVTRADDPDGHVLWILGTPPPLPKKMQWKSSDVEAVVRNSQEILLNSRIDVKPDERIGIFRGLTLLPAALGARKNPDDAQLKDVVSPEIYARWAALKKRFLPNDSGVERWRPIFAGNKLRQKAFGKLGLRESEIVTDVIEELAKKHKIPLTTPSLKFTFKADNIKAKIKEFSRERLNDEQCFDLTLQLTQALTDRDMTSARANAWATGDLQTLSELPALPSPYVACEAAVMSSQAAQALIPTDIMIQLRAVWVQAAEASLAKNVSTFAALPYGELTSTRGRLAMLREKGYLIEAPEGI